MIKKLLISLFIFSIAWGQSNGIKPPLGTQLDWGNRLTKGLVGAWFNLEAAPALGTLYDLSGNGNHGTLVADTHSVPGLDGPVLDFDGTGDYVAIDVTGQEWLSSAVGAVSLWCNPSSLSAIGTMFALADSAVTDNWGLFLRIETDGTVVVLVRSSSGGWRIIQASDSVVFSVGNWTHIAITQDGSGYKIYANSILLSMSDAYGQTSNALSDWWGAVSSLDRLWFGLESDSSPDNAFNGQIGSVLTYNRALSAREIAEHFRDRNILFKTQNIALIAAAGGAPPAEVGQLIMVSSIPFILILLFVRLRIVEGRQHDEEVDEQ